MTIKRITRDRLLTPEEAARYRVVRKQVQAELPELIARHHARMAGSNNVTDIVRELKAAREQQGLSLADVQSRTHIDLSTLTDLEADSGPNPTIETLSRYAAAVGKRLLLSLATG